MSATATLTVPTSHDGIDFPQDQIDAANKILADYYGTTVTKIEWTSHKDRDDLSKGNKHHTVRVEYTADAAIGAEYKNKPSNRDKETGALLWGEWLIYPLILTHKGNLYGRVEVVKSSIRGTYFVDGLEVTYKQYAALMNKSALGKPDSEEEKKNPTRTMSIKVQNLRVS